MIVNCRGVVLFANPFDDVALDVPNLELCPGHAIVECKVMLGIGLAGEAVLTSVGMLSGLYVFVTPCDTRLRCD